MGLLKKVGPVYKSFNDICTSTSNASNQKKPKFGDISVFDRKLVNPNANLSSQMDLLLAAQFTGNIAGHILPTEVTDESFYVKF